MRLVRGTTQDTKDESNRNRYRGNTWLFYIEDNDPAKLEAVERILDSKSTGFTINGNDVKWETYSDGCPCYKDGWGCGFWIDINDVPAFKEAFKQAKKEYKGLTK